MKNRNIGYWWLGLLAAPLFLIAHPASAQALSDGRGSVTQEQVRFELMALPEGTRSKMTREQMNIMINSLLLDRRLAEAAKAAGMADQPEVRARIERVTRDILVRSYLDVEMAKVATSLPDLTAVAKERYMANLSTYVEPEAIRVAHILIAVNEDEGKLDADAKAKAMQVLKQLREGADFAELAKEQSDDFGSKRLGGEIRGWSAKGKFVPTFEEAAFALKPGEISELVRTRFGYHIIKLLEKREARQLSFDEVKEPILAGVRNEMLGKKRKEFLMPFEGTKPIVLDDATFEALTKP